MTRDVEARLAVLEAKDELRELKTRYARVCDDRFDPVAMADLFTEDAVLDAGAAGSWHGRQAIVDYYSSVPARISWCMHHVSTASIEVDDDLVRARGSWCFFEPATINGTAVWVMGRYDDEYRREDRWRFSRMNLRGEASTPYDTGWERERFLGRAVPPDDVGPLARAAGLTLDAERHAANVAQREALRPLLEPLLHAPVTAEPAITFTRPRP